MIDKQPVELLELDNETLYSCADLACRALAKGLLDASAFPPHKAVVYLEESLARLLPPQAILHDINTSSEPIVIPRFIAKGIQWKELLAGNQLSQQHLAN